VLKAIHNSANATPGLRRSYATHCISAYYDVHAVNETQTSIADIIYTAY